MGDKVEATYHGRTADEATRDALAMAIEANYGTLDSHFGRVPHRRPTAESLADAILDWLRDHDAAVEARAWDACADEAHDLGWLHAPARDDVRARNPYRAAGSR